MELPYARALHGFAPGHPIDVLDVAHRYYELSVARGAGMEQSLWCLLKECMSNAVYARHADDRALHGLTARIQEYTAWGVPHRILLQHLALSSPTIRRALLVLAWLEETAPAHAHCVNPSVRGWSCTMANTSSRVTDGIDLIPHGDGTTPALDATDAEQEEALMDAMVRCLRRGDIHGAKDLACKRGFPWRAALLQHIIPTNASAVLSGMGAPQHRTSSGGDAHRNDGAAVPMFGEFAAPYVPDADSDRSSDAAYLPSGVGCMVPYGAINRLPSANTFQATEPNSDRGRLSVLSNIYNSAHAAVRAHTNKYAKRRYEQLESALYGLLCGDVSLVLPVMLTWRDRLWATLRCHVLAALSRHILELGGVECLEGIATGWSTGMATYVQHLHTYGVSNTWLKKAEDILTHSALECMPQDGGASVIDAVLAHVVMGILTNRATFFSRAQELVALHPRESSVWGVHFVDLLHRGAELGLLFCDAPAQPVVQWTPQSSDEAMLHVLTQLQHYWVRAVQEAKITANRGDRHALLQAPIYFICRIENTERCMETLARYCCDMHTVAQCFLEERELESVQDTIFSIVAQLFVQRSLCDPHAAVAELKERIAYSHTAKHGDANTLASRDVTLGEGEARDAGEASTTSTCSSHAQGSEDVVKWLASSVTPEHSHRVLTLALRELRSLALGWEMGDADSLRTCTSIVALLDRKVMPVYHQSLVNVAEGERLLDERRLRKEEYDVWRSFIHGKADVMVLMEMVRSSSYEHRLEVNAMQNFERRCVDVVRRLLALNEKACSYFVHSATTCTPRDHGSCDLPLIPNVTSPVLQQIGTLLVQCVRCGIEQSRDLTVATSYLSSYMQWADAVERFGVDRHVEKPVLRYIVDSAKVLTMETLRLHHMLRSWQGG